MPKDVLGHVIELASGDALDVFFEREIFSPLHMIDTGFYVKPEDVDRSCSKLY